MTKKGKDSITGQIVEILENTSNFKSKIESKGDQIVDKGAGITMASATLALPLIGLNHALALTYAGFGYQMRLSAPLSVLNYLRIASSNGILIKDGRALEKLVEVDTIIFDKTGTLTKEIPEINEIISFSDLSSAKLLQLASSAEQRQKHPIALAILEEAKREDIDILKIKNSNYEMGYGIDVILNDNKDTNILLGSERFMKLSKIEIPFQVEDLQQQSIKKGNSLVYISNKKRLLGVIELSTQIRPEAYQVVKELYAMNKDLYIISGDQKEPTEYLANKVGIKKHYAQTLPNDKAKIVEELQKRGKTVCFIGDGINDTVVLQKADVSISLHGASTIAMDIADILLIKPNLSNLPYLLKMSRDLDRQMNNSMKLNTVSSVSCVSAVVVLGMGYTGAVLFYYTAMGANIGYSMLPVWKEKKKTKKEKN